MLHTLFHAIVVRDFFFGQMRCDFDFFPKSEFQIAFFVAKRNVVRFRSDTGLPLFSGGISYFCPDAVGDFHIFQVRMR